MGKPHSMPCARVRRRHHGGMRRLSQTVLTLLAAAGLAATEPRSLLLERPLEDFGDAAYARAAEDVIAGFEARTGVNLRPGERKRCAIKLSTQSGAGLATPKPLVRAVAGALERRGFDRENIFLCDAATAPLRQAGFLPALNEKTPRFEGLAVRAWDTEARGWTGDPRLSYENPVPPPPGMPLPEWQDPRVSLMPKPLFDEVDFWVQLPVVADSADLGVHGAIACASLGNVTNAERFRGNPRNAALAAVEMCAAPELDRRRVLTLLSLERFQIRGGPLFDAGWCRSEKVLYGSANAVILDYLAMSKIRAARASAGTSDKDAAEPALFQAATSGTIRLGSARPADITLVRLPAR